MISRANLAASLCATSLLIQGARADFMDMNNSANPLSPLNPMNSMNPMSPANPASPLNVNNQDWSSDYASDTRRYLGDAKVSLNNIRILFNNLVVTRQELRGDLEPKLFRAEFEGKRKLLAVIELANDGHPTASNRAEARSLKDALSVWEHNLTTFTEYELKRAELLKYVASNKSVMNDDRQRQVSLLLKQLDIHYANGSIYEVSNGLAEARYQVLKAKILHRLPAVLGGGLLLFGAAVAYRKLIRAQSLGG